MISQGVISSPFGPIMMERTAKGLRSLQILTDDSEYSITLGYDQTLLPWVEQLEAYFNGSLQDFQITFDLRDQPEFYVHIWRILCTIPYGRTRTYSDIANFLRKPSLARAVGNAIAHNPLVIVIPCHRVIGKNGQLTGYIYGTDVKRKLLQHENPGHFPNQGQLIFNNPSLPLGTM